LLDLALGVEGGEDDGVVGHGVCGIGIRVPGRAEVGEVGDVGEIGCLLGVGCGINMSCWSTVSSGLVSEEDGRGNEGPTIDDAIQPLQPVTLHLPTPNICIFLRSSSFDGLKIPILRTDPLFPCP